MSEQAPTAPHTLAPLYAWLRPYLALFGALIAVYVAMIGLSAVDLDTVWEHPLDSTQWEFQAPKFLVQTDGENYYFNTRNHQVILEQMAINLTLGIGMTFVILIGGIDLSVGSLLALCNVVFVTFVLNLAGDAPPSTSLLIMGMGLCVLVGACAGVTNGLLSVNLQMPSFIVTLGMMFIARGIAYLISGGQTHTLLCPRVAEIAIPILVPMVVFLAGVVFLNTTAEGRRIFAVGGSLQASRYSGVATRRVRILCFAVSGMCAGLAGLIYWSRLSTGSHLAGETRELYAIAVVVLGGTRLAGGEGSIVGTLFGALIIAVLANGLNIAAVDEMTQKIIVGCVLVVAAYIDRRRAAGSLAEVR